jgi:hypothetical protein
MVTLSLRVLSHSTAIEPLLDIPTTRGSVQSVFPRAANLLLGGQLLTLHARETPCAPNGIVLALRATQKPLASLQAGMAFLVERGVLSLPALNLRLSFQQSQPWSPRPPLAPASCPPGRLRDNLTHLTAILAANAPPDGLAALALQLAETPETKGQHFTFLQKGAEAAQGLVEGAAHQQLPLLRQSASTLIGLGPGLTPSGDDVLVGFIAAMLLLSEAIGQSAALYQHFSAEVLAIASQRTNKLSLTWMEYAGRGEVAEHLGRLFQALVLEKPRVLENAALEVLSSGATSGGDLLAGIILGGRCLVAPYSKQGSEHNDIHGQ